MTRSVEDYATRIRAVTEQAIVEILQATAGAQVELAAIHADFAVEMARDKALYRAVDQGLKIEFDAQITKAMGE